MKKFNLILNAKKINEEIEGVLVQAYEVSLDNVSELLEADENSICFLDSDIYLEDAKKSKAGLIFVKQDFSEKLLENRNLMKIENPYIAFMMLVTFWLRLDSQNKKSLIDSSVRIPSSCKIGKNVTIKRNVFIDENVVIEKNSVIEANCSILESSKIGENCHLFPNVTIYQDSIIGKNVIIHSGTVIGADGFGFLLYNNIQNKIPQVGNVIIGDNVEIGSNTSIDRATLGSTVVGNGTKIDNLVQIGHNCKIGENSILCAQVGLAGSTIVGDNVYLAGQVGVAGHLKIGNKAMAGAQSGIIKNVEENAKIWGSPSMDANLQKKLIVTQKQYLDLHKTVKKVVKRFKEDEEI